MSARTPVDLPRQAPGEHGRGLTGAVAGAPARPVALPPVVTAELAHRAREIRSRDLGRRFDLSAPEAQAALAADFGGGSHDPGGYDAVVSVAELVGWDDLPAAVAALGRLLRPGGEMWLLEPIGRPGLWPALLSWLWSAHPSLSRLNLSRDLPAAVRATGMVVTDIERFTMAGAPWPLRPFVQLRATWVEA